MVDDDIQIIGSLTAKPRKLHPKFRPVSVIIFDTFNFLYFFLFDSILVSQLIHHYHHLIV